MKRIIALALAGLVVLTGCDENLVPATDGTYTVGDNATRYQAGYFNNLYSANVTISENVSVAGTVFLTDLPTSDPGVAGQLWVDGGILKVSLGTP